ncbi:MAG: hypothetical protein WAM42_06930, partial [Candidatus Nitrosopolaris sp.]
MPHAASQKIPSTKLKATRPTPNTTSTQLLKQIDSITENQPNYIIRSYKQMAEVNPDNAAIIYDYVSAEQTEINIKESTKGDKIKKLCWLSKYLNHKSYRRMTKQDILQYLN